MGNIVKLVFQSVLQGSGVSRLYGDVKALGKALPGLSQGASILGTAFGTVGGAFGRMATMFLQGGIWGATAEGMKLLITQTGIFKNRTEEVRKSLEDQKKAHEALLKSMTDGHAAALATIDKETAKRKELIQLTQLQAKAELEIKRANAVMRGDTSTVAVIDDELAKQPGRNAVAAADANVAGAESRVKAAKDALAEAERISRQAEDRLAKAKAELAAKSKPVEMLVQSTSGAYVQTIRRDTTAERERVKAAQAEADAAGEKAESAARAVRVEMQGLEKANKARKVALLEQEASEKKLAADRAKAEQNRARAKADADRKSAEDFEKKRKKALVDAENERLKQAEEAEKERAQRASELARKDEIKQHQKRLSNLGKEVDFYKKMLADAHGEVKDAWNVYRDPGQLDQKGERRAKRQEEFDKKRFEKDAERLKKRKDWRTADRLSNRDRATRDLLLAQEKEQQAGDKVASIDRSVKDILGKIEGLMGL